MLYMDSIDLRLINECINKSFDDKIPAIFRDDKLIT